MTYVLDHGRWLVIIACLIYILALMSDYGGNVSEPIYQRLNGQIENFRTQLMPPSSTNTDPRFGQLRQRLDKESKLLILDLLERRKGLWFKIFGWSRRLNSSVLEAGFQQLRNLQAAAIEMLTEPVVEARYNIALHELKLLASNDEYASYTHTRFDELSPEKRRSSLKEIQRRIDTADEARASKEFDGHRTAQWLTTVGLGSIIVTSFSLDHELVLLMGALGGFLAPLVSSLTGRTRNPWGLLALSPVGGALTAIGGLLLIRLLSDPNLALLGALFYDNSWTDPPTPVALAMALLLGFSGRLFSRLALSATNQLTPTSTLSDPRAPEE